MIRNEIDEFRLRVLQEMVEAEQRKERERQRQQRNCFHRYRLIPTGDANLWYRPAPMGEEGSVECTKCGKRK